MSASAKVPVIVWFRQDLRLGDNPAYSAAMATGQPVVPVYVLDDSAAGDWAMGAASRWWLHQSLASLSESLDGKLTLMRGSALDCLPVLVRETGATAVYANHCLEPWQRSVDDRLGLRLARARVPVHLFRAATLFEPAAVQKPDGTPYRVFTPFYRKACHSEADAPREPLTRPNPDERLLGFAKLRLAQLDLLPGIPWFDGLERAWEVGEAAALDRLDRFIERGLAGYREGRNRPDLEHVSRLSPYLHFGEISPHQIWHALTPLLGDRRLAADAEAFLRELGWREFSCYLLYHFPTLPSENLQERFDRFPWTTDDAGLERWRLGRTGYPIVDAGMRELWQTGYMHNRVRMIVGSFLVKNLLLHWHAGEAWFWDTLVDADLANNSASWQWIAGTGADAAPYFRIFNPVTQGRKFDPDGTYVRRYLPELRALDTADIHAPWEAPGMIRQALDYPEPVVDLAGSRERALAAFRETAREGSRPDR